jgi:YtkA-like
MYPAVVSRYIVALAVACIGCSTKRATPHKADCENTARIDPLAGGFVKHGAAGHFDFKLISMTPATPSRGDNKWVVEVDAAGTAARADVAATPFMPDHGHGTPVKVGVTASATPGQYELAPVSLWMPGYWEISVTATSGDDRDSAVFKLCIAS